LEVLNALLEKNGGYVSTKELQDAGITYRECQQLIEQGELERQVQGLYLGSDYFPDPFFHLQYRCPQGVFSHETALYLHDLSDRDPLIYMLTVPSGYGNRLMKEASYRFFYGNTELMQLGVMSLETPYGTQVKAFDKERTLCDCLKYIDQLDRDLVLTALKRYLQLPEKDKSKLLHYAEKLNIRDRVYQYLEVL